MVNNWRADVPIGHKVPWLAVKEAAARAGITKPVSPHTLRHYAGFRTIPGGQVFGLIGGVLTNIFPA
jgi:integrase/recombinase XerD